jgi:hypothetical protein
MAVGSGVGAGVGTGLTDRPHPNRRGATRRRNARNRLLRFLPIVKHPLKIRFKPRSLSQEISFQDSSTPFILPITAGRFSRNCFLKEPDAQNGRTSVLIGRLAVMTLRREAGATVV